MIHHNRNLLPKQGFWMLLLIGFLSSCATVKTEKISWNDEARLYEYPLARNQSVFLRMDNGELVNKSNFNDFIIELFNRKNRYSFDKWTDNAETLREEDYHIAQLYAESAGKLNDEKYSEAIAAIDSLKEIFQQSVLYSDVAFLEGYALEKTGDSLSADTMFSNYVRFSSQKYSDRFRGYKYTDINDSLWLQQRKYALNFLEKDLHAIEPVDFPQITPKYYLNSLQPGYILNDESQAENKTGIIFFGIATSFSKNIALSLQFYRHLFNNFDINAGYNTSPGVASFNLAVPLQLYRSVNNKAGIKISPFIFYSKFSELEFDNRTWSMDELVLNPGFRISAGYYFVQRFSVGTWYTWFYFNEKHPYSAKTQPLNLWWNNNYDISLYFNILKGFSLKGGVQNSNAVAGIYWNGWEISYNFTNPGIISRMDLF